MTRHQFTLDDVLDLISQGMISKRVQLLGGEIYNMPADGYRHQKYAIALNKLFTTKLAATPATVAMQTTLRMSAFEGPSPDLFVLAGSLPEHEVPADEILVVIEVADSSLRFDLGDAAIRYAVHGVCEYWVIDVNTPCIYVHCDPVNGAYPPPQKIDAATPISARLIPDVSVRLADIA